MQKFADPYLHDGSAATLDHAIRAHREQAIRGGFWSLFLGGRFLAMLAKGFSEAGLEGFGDGVRLAALIDLDRLAGGVNDHPAVRALSDVLLQLLAELGLDFAVQVIGDFA